MAEKDERMSTRYKEVINFVHDTVHVIFRKIFVIRIRLLLCASRILWGIEQHGLHTTAQCCLLAALVPDLQLFEGTFLQL